jgi:AraC-like DNA-binding protein
MLRGRDFALFRVVFRAILVKMVEKERILEARLEVQYKFYYKSEARPLSSLSVHEEGCAVCPPGHRVEEKSPADYGLYIVVEGKGRYSSGKGDFSMEMGQCFVTYPGTPFSCEADDEEPWTLCWVRFDGSDARLLINAAAFSPQNPWRQLSLPIAEQAADIIAHLYVFRGEEVFALVQSTAMLYALMAFLIKEISWDQRSMPPGWTGAVHIRKALDYIAANYSRPITVQDIAGSVNLSRSRLYRVFLRHISQSPQRYLTEFRVREACNLLQKRTGSIKEIAYAVGFENPLYFSTAFKQVMGKSPRAYMREFSPDEPDAEEGAG